jgi:uncharacterized membrane protein
MQLTDKEKQVVNFLREKQMFCFKHTILNGVDIRRTTLSRVLRELRKRKIVFYKMRRWGFNYETL